MNMLVTGGSGFLGRRTSVYFEKAGWQVFAPSHAQLDITDSAAVSDWFRQHRPDAVIHTAAISDTGLCQQRPEWSEAVNVTGCVHLASACRETGARLVICSSDQVYAGSRIPGPHRESESVTPGNVYGAQKLRAEQQCLSILPETICLRLSWMYAQDSFPGEHGHFLTTVQAVLKDGHKPLLCPIHDRRGITDVADVVKNLPLALGLSGGVWNFGSENNQNTYATMKAVLKKAGMTAALKQLAPNEEAFRDAPRDISMDLTQLHSAGIHFPTTEEALLRALICSV